MPVIAREFNLSETVFVLPPADPVNSARLRIFTPGRELPFAGHPTVGAACVLGLTGVVPLTRDVTSIVLEEKAVLVPVSIYAEGGRVTGAQLTAPQTPTFGPPVPDAGMLARILGIDEDAVIDSPWQPQAVSCGVPFLFIVIRNRADLARARVDLSAWNASLQGAWADALFVLCFDPERPGSHVRARMFSPGFGIPEDPATGSAVAALGGYLGARVESDGTHRWRIEQGFEMGRPSLLDLEADVDHGAVVRVRVGGGTVLVSEGWLTVD